MGGWLEIFGRRKRQSHSLSATLSLSLLVSWNGEETSREPMQRRKIERVLALLGTVELIYAFCFVLFCYSNRQNKAS